MPHDPKITPLFTTSEPFELDGYLHVEVGDEVLGGFLGRDEETRKDERAKRVVESAMRRHGDRLGAGAKVALEHDVQEQHERWQPLRRLEQQQRRQAVEEPREAIGRQPRQQPTTKEVDLDGRL